MFQNDTRKIYIASGLIALVLAGGALVYKFAIALPHTISHTIPTVGKVGSAHAHASLLVMNKEKVVSFCDPQFMLRSQYVHFENNNCTVVHRHASGVTMPTFFKTLGVELSSMCLSVPHDGKYCDNGKDHLIAMINGQVVAISDLPYYEFKNNDHILINYGPETGTMLKFKFNQVPPIPMDVNEPLAADAFGNAVNAADIAPLQNTK